MIPTPQQEAYLPFAVPFIGEEEIEAVVECLQSGWITTGPRVREFEARFAEYVGVRHAIALNSCTAALHLALDALGVQEGDEVLVPTMTFAATAEVARYLGARPVLLDCDARTLNLDPDALDGWLQGHAIVRDGAAWNRHTGARVRALIPVHYGGLPCDMERILLLARRFHLHVVEDAAHALPAETLGKPAGTLGDAGAYSFYATKNITTGEGGMLTTDDDALAARARMMSLHGISRDAWLRYTAQGSWYYEILEPGYKYNMTDIAAALGLAQMRRSEQLWEIRARYAARYTEAFRKRPEIEPPADAPEGVRHAWHLYPIRLNLESIAIDRARFIEELRARGIGVSVHFIPLHLHPYYRETFGWAPSDLPVAAREYERLISLPLYPRMTDSDVQRVIDAVSEVAACHRR